MNEKSRIGVESGNGRAPLTGMAEPQTDSAFRANAFISPYLLRHRRTIAQALRERGSSGHDDEWPPDDVVCGQAR